MGFGRVLKLGISRSEVVVVLGVGFFSSKHPETHLVWSELAGTRFWGVTSGGIFWAIFGLWWILAKIRVKKYKKNSNFARIYRNSEKKIWGVSLSYRASTHQKVWVDHSGKSVKKNRRFLAFFFPGRTDHFGASAGHHFGGHFSGNNRK